ncbi:MAG TPA: 2Fe-2S iron-sulfur cluster-binding protein [Dehalococcoidia bacterium]|nr:2Fe-2S iron-sulfur cluster-binding protein [Dehalococcoidia bacterium]
MGSFRVAIEIGDPQGQRFQPIEALVDTGATYTWVPRDILEQLGVRPSRRWNFILADGREVEYDIAWTMVRLNGEAAPSVVIFGEPGAEPLLGVFTLEAFRLGVDAVNRRLIPTPGLLKAHISAQGYPLRFIVNGRTEELAIPPNRTLLEVLRDELYLTGTKEGCGTGNCGACTVILDGHPVLACLTLALEAEGSEILTIEGLTANGELHPLQRAFIEHGAVQCGFCTPGFILAAKALLERNPNPTTDEIRQALSGNLCRCTGYVRIIEAVAAAART